MSFAKINLHELSKLHRSKKKKYEPKKKEVDNELNCIYCNAKKLIPDDGRFLCKACNFYQSKHIDFGQEWRDYNMTDESRQCRSSMISNEGLLSENNIGTKIGYCQKNNSNSNYVRTRHNWTTTNYKDDSLRRRYKTITNICRTGNINGHIIEESKIVFMKISEVKTARRSKLQALMATAVIIGHRICGLEKSFIDIAKIFDLDIKILRKMVKEYEFIWEAIQTKEEEEINKLREEEYELDKITPDTKGLKTKGKVKVIYDKNKSGLNDKNPHIQNGKEDSTDILSIIKDVENIINLPNNSEVNTKEKTKAVSKKSNTFKNGINKEDNKILKSFMISLEIELLSNSLSVFPSSVSKNFTIY